jgi:hypothetical protein
MSLAGIDVVAVAGLHRYAAPWRRRHDDRAEEDLVYLAEEGVVQLLSGLGALPSIVLLLLCRR